MRVYKPLRPETHPIVSWTEKGLGRTPGPRRHDLFGVYPGEEVEVLVGQRQAWVGSVRRPHPDRREPLCPHFGSCGGCTLQSLDYQAQLRLKTDSVLSQLAEMSPETEILPPRPSPSLHHYRSKVEFSILRPQAAATGKARVGFHWRGRFDNVVEVQHCFLTPPPHAEVVRHTREWAWHHALQGWHPRTQTGQLRYLVFRRSSCQDSWLAVLITTPEVTEDLARDWAARLQGLGPRGLVWARQSSPACAAKPESQQLLLGEADLPERLGELHFRLTWQSFFQSNPPAYQQMLETARGWCDLKAGATVLDLFCGIGTLGMCLLPPQGRLIGVESVPEAVEDARKAAALNGLEGEFHCCPAQDWTDLSCDLLILDPPRSGFHPKLMERLLAQGPKRILFVSCNPYLWLRQARDLSERYRVVRAQPFDFFPHTRHVELLALLERS